MDFKIEVVASDGAGEDGSREVVNLTRTQKHGGDPYLSCQGRQQKTSRYTNQILGTVDR